MFKYFLSKESLCLWTIPMCIMRFHIKEADDQLDADKMNVGVGGKQPILLRAGHCLEW